MSGGAGRRGTGGGGAGARRGGRALTVLAAIALPAAVLLAAWPPPARAQLTGAFTPALNRITGGVLWFSLGFRDPARPEQFTLQDRHPIVRGGFAAFLGTFGAQPDTTVALDSVKTTVEWSMHPAGPGVTRTDTIRAVKTTHSSFTLPGRDAKITIAAGYSYSGNYQVHLARPGGTLDSTFPIGGFYGAVFFGPFPIRYVPATFFWEGSVAGQLVQLTNANGRSEEAFVRFDTERAVSPELSLILGWRLRRGSQALIGLGVQHVRFSAIRYRAPSEAPLDDAVLQRLPDVLRLTSVHLTVGLSFDANQFFARR